MFRKLLPILLLCCAGCARKPLTVPAPLPVAIPSGFAGIVLSATSEAQYAPLGLPYQRMLLSAVNMGTAARDIDSAEAVSVLHLHIVSAAMGNAALNSAHINNLMVRGAQDLTTFGTGSTVTAAFSKAFSHATPYIALGTFVVGGVAAILQSRAPNQAALALADPKPSYKLAAYKTEGYGVTVEVYTAQTDKEITVLLP